MTLELRIERTNTNQMECIKGFLMMARFYHRQRFGFNATPAKDEVKEIRVLMGGKTVSQPKWMTC